MEDNSNKPRDEAIKDFGSGKGDINTTILFIILMTFSFPLLILATFRFNASPGRYKGTDFEEFANCSVHLSHEAKFSESELNKNDEVNFNTTGLFPFVDIYGNSRKDPIANAYGAYLTSYDDLKEAVETFGLDEEEILKFDKNFFESQNLAFLLRQADKRDPYKYVYVGNKRVKDKEYIQFEKDNMLDFDGKQVHAYFITIDKDVPFVAFEIKTDRIVRVY